LLRHKFISAALNLGKSVAENNQDVKEILDVPSVWIGG